MTSRDSSPRTSVSQRLFGLMVGGLLLASGMPVLAAVGDGSLSDPNLRFVGRWDKSNSSVYTSNWGGAYLSTKFTGQNITVKVASPTSFE